MCIRIFRAVGTGIKPVRLMVEVAKIVEVGAGGSTLPAPARGYGAEPQKLCYYIILKS